MIDRTVDIDGAVHYVEFEGPAEGPTFVCVHGLGGSWINWLGVAPALAQHGRVLALDLVGFGWTPTAGRSASVHANAGLVAAFIHQVVRGPVILLGNSMGGAIGITVAATHPDVVAGLVLIDPASPRAAGVRVDPIVAATFATYMIPRVGETMIARRLRAMGPEAIARQTLQLCTVDPARVPQEIVERLIALAKERASSMPWATDAFLEAARSLVRLLAKRAAYMERVAAISCPTLLIQGSEDRLVALGATDALARARPDWDYVVFDDLGHVPMMEDPLRTSQAIDRWLRGPSARALRGGRLAEEV